MNKDFIKALEEKNLDLIRKIPKSDLHNHGTLGCRLKVVEKWLGFKLPEQPTKMKTLEEMNDFIKNALTNNNCFTQEGFEFIFEEALLEAKNDGIKILEMSIDSHFATIYSNKEIGLISALERIHKKVAIDIIFLPELGLMRDRPLKDITLWAEPCIETGYFKSIDLYGLEHNNLEDFKFLYKKAKNKGMKLKAHAGEFRDAEFVRYSVETLELDEVQHGITAAQSKEVMNWLRDNNIQLNICPTSNVKLSRVESLATHPIRILFDNGIKVTINSDDIIIFNQSVSEEYLDLYKAGLFNAEELDIIREYGLGR